MAKSDVLLGLIKEVVKNEVKQQLKEEIVKLVKSGAITITNKQNSNKPKFERNYLHLTLFAHITYNI